MKAFMPTYTLVSSQTKMNNPKVCPHEKLAKKAT